MVKSSTKQLISDANIIIDLDCCQLTDLVFSLPYCFYTPDILFEKELKESHGDLINKGLKVLSLNEQSMMYVFQLNSKYTKTSIYDVMALSLSKQLDCPLLTGDKALREAAKEESVLIHGTIWILEQLIVHQYISKEQALAALEQMQINGRRLPFEKAEKQIRNLSIHNR